MSFRMAKPGINPTTKVGYLRQRTPKDMQHLAGSVVKVPIAGIMKSAAIRADVVQVSPERKEPEQIKLRHAQAEQCCGRSKSRSVDFVRSKLVLKNLLLDTASQNSNGGGITC